MEEATMNFQVERLNIGGGMNLGTGIFTAPASGFYYFAFSAVKGGGHLNTELKCTFTSTANVLLNPMEQETLGQHCHFILLLNCNPVIKFIYEKELEMR